MYKANDLFDKKLYIIENFYRFSKFLIQFKSLIKYNPKYKICTQIDQLFIKLRTILFFLAPCLLFPTSIVWLLPMFMTRLVHTFGVSFHLLFMKYISLISMLALIIIISTTLIQIICFVSLFYALTQLIRILGR